MLHLLPATVQNYKSKSCFTNELQSTSCTIQQISPRVFSEEGAVTNQRCIRSVNPGRSTQCRWRILRPLLATGSTLSVMKKLKMNV